MHVRLMREQPCDGQSGPLHGMFLLQRGLRKHAPSWLHIGGHLRPGEIPWFWHWEDGPDAATFAARGEPVIIGPNILFENSRMPKRISAERAICDGRGPMLLVTESDWYDCLIRRNLCGRTRARVHAWPYPVEMTPYTGKPIEHELLIYVKSGLRDVQAALEPLRREFRHVREIHYGHYRRADLIDEAARSRVCFYVSDDDRGPLALAEILSMGCPCVGVSRGAPWIEEGRNGFYCGSLVGSCVVDCLRKAANLEHSAIAQAAREKFDADRIAAYAVSVIDTFRGSLDRT